MKFWNDFDRSVFFNKVFTSPVPIGEITLFSIDIDNDRPHIYVNFDIPELPDAPPKKWVEEGFNTCRIGLNCGGISDVLIKNIPTNETMKISVKRCDDYFLIRAVSSNSLLEFKTRTPSLSGPSVYFCDPDSACY